MELITTPSFELAVYKRGNSRAEKVMLCLPGRLDTKDYPHMRSHVDYFSQKGYLAVSFDPPGTWESGGDMGLYSMTNYAQAINELIEHFDNRPTVLMGHSRGGTMAMFVGSLNPYVTHIVAAMSHTGESEVSEETLKTGIHISRRDTPEWYAERERIFHLPLSYFEDGKKHNVMGVLKNCAKPKLFLYGMDDDLVTPKDVKAVYNAVAEPKEIHELNCDHDYRKNQEMINEVNSVVSDFLEKYTPT